MKEATKYRIKAFMWDQFVRPFFLIFNLNQLRSLLLALIIIAAITKEVSLFWFFVVILFLVSVYETYTYYKSGEFMKNYRDYRFPDYRKAIKSIRREEKQEEKSASES